MTGSAKKPNTHIRKSAKASHAAPSQTVQQREKMIDEEEKESFPASDPPSYAGGQHIVGAPVDRKTKTAKPPQGEKT